MRPNYAMHSGIMVVRDNSVVSKDRGQRLSTVIVQCAVLGGSDYTVHISKRKGCFTMA